MRNIVFASTRQWNPGDEIILDGVVNLFRAYGEPFNALLYNRNPSIRNNNISNVSLIAEDGDWSHHHIQSGMLDNSVKPWQDYCNIDAIVFAGTPDWESERCKELYLKAVEYNVPVFHIGLEGEYQGNSELIRCVMDKSRFVSVRNPDILSSFLNKGIKAYCLPCPSIFASNETKTIENVNCIGLIYRAKSDEVTTMNGWDSKKYDYQMEIYKWIIDKYAYEKRIILICHYSDELALAERDFPGIEVYYSYDSKEYYDIYKMCDLIIGSRIHGIGLATSLAIPSIPIKYDFRGGTLNMFMPKTEVFTEVNQESDIKKKIDDYISNIKIMNEDLTIYKRDVKNAYKKVFFNSIDYGPTLYDYTVIKPSKQFVLKTKKIKQKSDKELNNELIREITKECLQRINFFLKDKRIIIKGAGWHTNQLIKYLENDIEIVAVADNGIDKEFNGIKCIKNEEIVKYNFDYILLSSHKYNEEMRIEMKKIVESKKIISMYDFLSDNYYDFLGEEDLFAYMSRTDDISI